ncbi:MAG: hypothetical protein ACYDA8_03110, partial [Deferrisomatales bacterium]
MAGVTAPPFPVPEENRVASLKALLALPHPEREPYLDYLVPAELIAHYRMPGRSSWAQADRGAYR